MGRDPVLLADIAAISMTVDLIETQLRDLQDFLHRLLASLRNGNVTEEEP